MVVGLVLSPATQAFRRDALDVKLPDVPVPPGATWFWGGQHMSYNGIPMSIKIFEYFGDERDVVDFYNNLWKSSAHGHTSVKNYGLYRIMGYEARGFYISVQFRQEGSFVKGKITTTETPGKRRPSFKTRLPKPPSAEVVNVVENLDGGQRTETVTIHSNKPVSYNAQYYARELKRLGWALVYQKGDGRNTVINHYQKSSQLLQITIKKLTVNDTNRSHILIHWMK